MATNGFGRACLIERAYPTPHEAAGQHPSQGTVEEVLEVVTLNEVKGLLSLRLNSEQILRYAQNDTRRGFSTLPQEGNWEGACAPKEKTQPASHTHVRDTPFAKGDLVSYRSHGGRKREGGSAVGAALAAKVLRRMDYPMTHPAAPHCVRDSTPLKRGIGKAYPARAWTVVIRSGSYVHRTPLPLKLLIP